jgi:hypothetical protein
LHAPSARPQEPTSTGFDSASAPRAGVIGGHEFIPSSFIKDPFVRTYLQTGLGFGSTLNLTIPRAVVHGKTLSGPKGNLLFAVLDMEYQYAIRTWLAVRGRLDVTGRMANETSTLVAQGITLYSGFELGWLFKMTESERFWLSGSLGVKNSSTTDVYLQRFIEGIVENGQVLPGNNLVVATPTLRGTAGIQGAYVLSHLTGITVTGNLDYGESMNGGEGDKWYYGASAAFDFNLHSQSGVPVGFVIGGSTGSAPDLEGIDNRTAQTVFGRIAYTGADEFALGLDLAYHYFPVRNTTEKQNVLSAVVDIRLYF